MSISLDDLEVSLTAALDSPTHAEVGDITVSKPSGYEKVAVAKYLSSLAATRDFAKAFTRVKIVPPGSV
jgi:hypothetical protein